MACPLPCPLGPYDALDGGGRLGLIAGIDYRDFRMSRLPPSRRADYRWFHAITTRWMDNDVFQHVNNVNYFSYLDTAVTYYEMTEQVVGLLDGPTHCVVAEVAC